MSLILEPLPYPVYFVCRVQPKVWSRLTKAISEVQHLDAEDIIDHLYKKIKLWSPYDYSGIGTDILNWPIQTYIQLMKQGLDVKLVSGYVPGKICILAYEQLSSKRLGFRSFVVGCQYDRGRPELCNYRIVQNQINVIDPVTDHFIPHWPQPNLIPRETTRGHCLNTLTYKGRLSNLSDSFRKTSFIQRLARLQITLEARDQTPEDLKQAWIDWHDYSSTDAVLAVRDSNPFLFNFKPASKLVNAWLAGCPALLGPEPAYQQLRQSDLDYLEVRSCDDAIAALRHLKDNPGYYKAMVENGRRRAQEYNANRIAQYWRDTLAGPIAEGYERWKHQSIPTKLIGRPIWYWKRIRLHRQQRFLFESKL